MRIIFRKQDVGAECVHCYWSVTASRPSQKSKEINIKATQKYQERDDKNEELDIKNDEFTLILPA